MAEIKAQGGKGETSLAVAFKMLTITKTLKDMERYLFQNNSCEKISPFIMLSNIHAWICKRDS